MLNSSNSFHCANIAKILAKIENFETKIETKIDNAVTELKNYIYSNKFVCIWCPNFEGFFYPPPPNQIKSDFV